MACPRNLVIASLHNSRLLLRSVSDGTILRSVQLDPRFAARCNHIKWSRAVHEGYGGGQSEPRLLLANEDTVHIYDVSDPQWHAVLDGASSNTGKIANVEFGHTVNEVIVSSDFSLKTTIWSLLTSRGIEIKDPKVSSCGSSLRPSSGHLAVLTRDTMKDVVMILTPGSRGVDNSFTLTTIDAQGLKWSPDGRWLATWEVASVGFTVLIYTADGNLFKTYHGRQDMDMPRLGVRMVEWEPSGRYLAVGDYDNQIHLLSAQTVSPCD